MILEKNPKQTPLYLQTECCKQKISHDKWFIAWTEKDKVDQCLVDFKENIFKEFFKRHWILWKITWASNKALMLFDYASNEKMLSHFP